MNNDEEKRSKLIAEIERLKKENEILQKDINVIEHKDQRLRAQHRIGREKKLLYWRMPARCLNTVFFTRKEQLIKEVDVCLMEKEFLYAIKPFRLTSDFSVPVETYRAAVICEDIIDAGDEGYRLALFDPYKRILSNPLKITYSEAYSLKGKLLYIEFSFDEAEKGDIFIRKWELTKFTLCGYDGVQDEIKNPIAEAVAEFKKVSSEEEAVAAVTTLQNYFKLKVEKCKVARTAPTELRVLHKEKSTSILYGIFFIDNELWLYMEPDHDYTIFYSSYLDKMLPGTHKSDEHLAKERWAFKNLKEPLPEVEEDIEELKKKE